MGGIPNTITPEVAARAGAVAQALAVRPMSKLEIVSATGLPNNKHLSSALQVLRKWNLVSYDPSARLWSQVSPGWKTILMQRTSCPAMSQKYRAQRQRAALRRRVLALLDEAGDLTKEDLAEALSGAVTDLIIGFLIRKGLVVKEERKGVVRYYIAHANTIDRITSGMAELASAPKPMTA